MTDDTRTSDAAQWWEERYAQADDPVWSGRVNAVLADVAEALPAGRALDLGCGEGGDAVWLAQHGWTVVGVDLSPTAVRRAAEAAVDAGVGDRTDFVAADLATWSSEERFDLVTASFLHSWPAEIPRDAILRRAGGFVAPGGTVLITSHAAPPPWAPAHLTHGHRLPTPQEDLAALDPPSDWRVVAVETRQRAAVGPDGQPATLTDGVVIARRPGPASAPTD